MSSIIKVKHFILLTLYVILSILGTYLLFASIFNAFSVEPLFLLDNLKVPVLNITTDWRINLVFLPLFFSSLFWALSLCLKDKISPFLKKLNDIPLSFTTKTQKTFFKINKISIFFFIMVIILFSLLLYIDNSFFITEIYLFIFMLIFIVLLAISMIDIKKIKFSRFDILCIFIIPLLYMSIYMYFLTDPKKIHWGDEGAFYDIAREILEHGISRSFFDKYGVYGFHPLSASYFQALLMVPFGISIFSFRMTSIISIMLSIPAIYLIVKEISSRITGGIALLLICFSHYFYNFSYLAYNNTFLGIFTLMWGLYFFMLSKKYFSIGYGILSGLFLGLCWYLYGVVILSSFTILITTICLSGENFKKNFFISSAIYLTISIIILPLTGFDVEENIKYISRHSNYQKENITFINLLVSRLKFGFINPFMIGHYSHWLAGPTINFITSFFMFIGIILFLFKHHVTECQKIFLLFSITTWGTIMLSTPYDDFSNTRITYLVIFWLIFASHGIYYFIKMLSDKKSKIIIGTIIFLSIVYFNYYYGCILPFQKVYTIGYEGLIAQISLDNKNIGNLYAISPSNWKKNHFDNMLHKGYLVPNDIIIVNESLVSSLPKNLQKNDVIILETRNEFLIENILTNLKNKNLKAIVRKNLEDRGEVLIIAQDKMTQKFIDDASPDKLLVTSLYLPSTKS